MLRIKWPSVFDMDEAVDLDCVGHWLLDHWITEVVETVIIMRSTASQLNSKPSQQLTLFMNEYSSFTQVWSRLTAEVLLETSCPGSEYRQLVVLCLCIQSNHSYCSCSGWFNSRAVTMWGLLMLLIRQVLLKILWSPVHCSPARCCNRMHAVTLSQMYIS